LIKALARLPDQLPVIALIAGRDKNADRCQKMARELGCHERMRFLGYQKNTATLYGAADLFVLPSLFDPIANVVLEALYTGTPVINGQQVGAGELIQNGENGFVVSDFKPATLAQTNMSCFQTSHKEKMSSQAHQATATYRWDLHLDRMENIFLQVLEKKIRGVKWD
jgi:UDP-glucose:(heptosyl)LPS alpha-1,3-glucosyltransferase